MLALALATALCAAPTGPATKLVGIWLDHSSPYMELRPDGSGRIGALENKWTAEEKDKIHVVNNDTGDTFDIPYTLDGKKLKLIVQNTQVELEKSSKKPAAKAPPPPKKPSELAEEAADAGTKTKKKGKGK